MCVDLNIVLTPTRGIIYKIKWLSKEKNIFLIIIDNTQLHIFHF